MGWLEYILKSADISLSHCMYSCLSACKYKSTSNQERALESYRQIDVEALKVLEMSYTKKDGTLDFAVKGGKRKAFEKKVLKIKLKCEKALKKNGWL